MTKVESISMIILLTILLIISVSINGCLQGEKEAYKLNAQYYKRILERYNIKLIDLRRE